jgi:sulfate transport system ATP-binding protein
MTRNDYTALRDRLGLRNGSQVHLRPRRITRFSAGANAVVETEVADPAAMI